MSSSTPRSRILGRSRKTPKKAGSPSEEVRVSVCSSTSPPEVKVRSGAGFDMSEVKPSKTDSRPSKSETRTSRNDSKGTKTDAKSSWAESKQKADRPSSTRSAQTTNSTATSKASGSDTSRPRKSSNSEKPRPPRSSTSGSRSNTETQNREGASQSRSSNSNSRRPPRQSRDVSATNAMARVATSAGTARLNRILQRGNTQDDDDEDMGIGSTQTTTALDPVIYSSRKKSAPKEKKMDRVHDPYNETEVGRFVADTVPLLRVDPRSIGGESVAKKATTAHLTLTNECLACFRVKSFDSTGGMAPTALQGGAAAAAQFAKNHPVQRTKHKLYYVCLVRSTNKELIKVDRAADAKAKKDLNDDMYENEEHGDKEEETAEEEEEEEISTFPVLVCMGLPSDGTNPDLRKLIELNHLTTVAQQANSVQLVFRGSDTVRIHFATTEDKPGEAAVTMRRERFLMSTLMIHTLLCASVVERTSGVAAALAPLNVRNVDRGELQYLSTVNGFLQDSPALMVLLERQRTLGRSTGEDDDEEESGDKREERKVDEDKTDMDGIAYDMMMGNYSTRVDLFVSAEERNFAEEVLNDRQWQKKEDQRARVLGEDLNQRMHDLEAETCRRLIAWEDEKMFSQHSGDPLFQSSRDTVDALSLAALFQTLSCLDQELGTMEIWLLEKAAEIKPLTDDCQDIEEENRRLEQQWISYGILGKELDRLLHGLNVPANLEQILKNPASVLVYNNAGAMDVAASEAGIKKVHEAGKALKEAMDRADQEGGIHMRALNERVQGLSNAADSFCTALAQIVVTVMEQLAAEVVSESDEGKVSRSDTNTSIAKKIRDAQRRFQSSLLAHIKLIEVLALLKPKLLPAIRDAYSELVAEGILMKKRMKGYFQSLPGKNNALATATVVNLKDYQGISPRTGLASETLPIKLKTVNAPDMHAALTELLPVIAREAYFTAALFGLSSKHLDGREKKRNFESAKKSVDNSSQYFRYYIERTCGIVPEQESDDETATEDPMLSLVASVYLNEAMDSYIDREKKGGDQSLSLAYVRATILELRKKVDKQWVAWVEDQISWIRSNPGVPANGKRAGIYASFARFPSYLDHIVTCCKEGRDEDYTPNLANIKVVSYYLQKIAGALFASLHECAERETTDQQYGANVMRMENSYFFTQSIKQRGMEFTTLFQKQMTAASAICKQSTDAYLGWMIKREFKVLHALFSNISRIRRDVGDADVPIHVPKNTFVKTLSKESNKDVMKEKIHIIYSRMEKHLSEDGGLLPIAWKALVKVLYEWFGRWEKLSSQCYKHVLEPSANDIVRIAKAASTGASSASTVAGSTTSKDTRETDTARLAKPEGRKSYKSGGSGMSAAAKKLDSEF